MPTEEPVSRNRLAVGSLRLKIETAEIRWSLASLLVESAVHPRTELQFAVNGALRQLGEAA